MKKVFLGIFVLIVFASLSFAADFTPTVMTLTAPAQIEYNFDGENLTIPFTVSGTPAAVWLVINTKGKADNIVDIRNGWLGWHYVNRTDTTIYVSQKYSREIGDTQITWDGRDENGNIVSPDDYSYYLWAYDDKTSRQMVSDYLMIGFEWQPRFNFFYTEDEDGLPLANPLLFGSWPFSYTNPSDAETPFPFKMHGSHYKFVLGSDPYDPSLIQYTQCAYYQNFPSDKTGDPGYFKHGGPILDPHDYGIFYHGQYNVDAKTETLLKWSFVSDGDAVEDLDWGGWDNIIWEDRGNTIGVYMHDPTIFTDGDYIFRISTGKFLTGSDVKWNQFRAVDFDGDVLVDVDLPWAFMPDDPNPADRHNDNLSNFCFDPTRPGLMIMEGTTSCRIHMIDYFRLLAEPYEQEYSDIHIWENANGDYFMDTAFDPAVEPAWFCLQGGKGFAPRINAPTIDSQGLCFISVGEYFNSLYSFGVTTQDGTAITLASFADDTVPGTDGKTGGGALIDYGSNFDGIYYCAPLVSGGGDNFNKITYVAFDSTGGVITNQPVAVEEEAQAAFSVAQNTPNPFNPTTTIGFSLPDAGQVTVDIYNVAGQKVDTLVNDYMDTGKHSVVWDASVFSAGVYFYTVKSGDFSKTMKMTLLK